MKKGKWYWLPETNATYKALFFFERKRKGTHIGTGFVWHYSRLRHDNVSHDSWTIPSGECPEATPEEVEEVKLEYIFQQIEDAA